MKNIIFNYSNSFVKEHEIEFMKTELKMAHDLLHSRSGPGKEFTGWLDYPMKINKNEFSRIKETGEKIRRNSDVFIVIGIGGSYLGARACIEALSHSFFNSIPREKRKTPEIYFAGNSMSSTYIAELFDVIEGKDISINVISKSGTTTEPAVTFRIFKEYLEKKYGKKEASKRIYVTTDESKGALRKLADIEGYTSFTIPDNIGGRYSIFTSVGLLPITVAGIDIDNLILGAKDGVEEYSKFNVDKNIAYQYAIIRNALYRKGKEIEILLSYEPRLFFLQEWWKQLYGESEGKDGKGIYPASANFTTDLHSLGQLIQDGKRNIFETTINIDNPRKDLKIKENIENLDGLNFLKGKTINFINKKAYEGTVMAHVEGRVPNVSFDLPEMNEYYFGKLIYLFEKSCAISGYMLGVNPFDQPGVEKYKQNMFKLIGKPGY